MLDTLSLLIGYFYGGGIGWWLFFFVLAVAATIYIFYDSSNRNLEKTTFWRMAMIVNLGLFLPTILFRFTVRLGQVVEYYVLKQQIAQLEPLRDTETWINAEIELLKATISETLPALTQYFEPIAFIGLLAGVAAIGLALGYFLTFRGAAGKQAAPVPGGGGVYPPPPIYTPQPEQRQSAAPMRSQPSRPKVNAWLVMKANGKSYQLNQGSTTVGRSTSSDIPVINDPTVSGQHMKIMEENGHFKLVDIGSTNGTWVNGHRVRQPVMLTMNDEIRLGDNTHMKFVAS